MAKGKKSYKRQDQKGQKDAEVSVHVNGVAQESAVAVGSTEPISSKSSDDFAPTPAMTASKISEPTPPTSVAASTLPLSSAASDALPSPSQQQAVQQPSASHFRPSGNDSICDHIFNVGFHRGEFSDVTLQIFGVNFNRTFRLHRLMLARSPMLSHLLTNAPGHGEVVLNVSDKNVTDISMGICLGYLYASWNDSLVNAENATSVLATAWFLRLEDMCQLATNIICSKSINQHSVQTLVEFVESADTQNITNGDLPNGHSHVGYGPHTAYIKGQLQEYIVTGLARELGAFGNQQSPSTPPPGFSMRGSAVGEGNPGYTRLVDIYSALPFEYLKSSVESSAFPVVSDMQRYHFAKEVVAKRELAKKQRGVQTPPSSPGALQAMDKGEESVVLAFGGGPNSVTIVRRPPKGAKAKLWKTPRQNYGEA